MNDIPRVRLRVRRSGLEKPLLGRDPDINRAARKILNRYFWLMERSLPELTVEEMTAIIDAYDTEYLGYELTRTIRHLPSQLKEAGDVIGDRYSFDWTTLCARALEWTDAEKVAVIDACERHVYQEDFSVEDLFK